jgi:diadenosine tetraphosphate (Ap4A) HIT family hydrolase
MFFLRACSNKEVLSMQHRSPASTDAEMLDPDCPFCQVQSIAAYVLQESDHFRIVADHAPLIEGHILIIPKLHYACYGAVPASLDEELAAMRTLVSTFFQTYYISPAYWEHGVFRQTVFHAHLHCIPIGPVRYTIDEMRHALVVDRQEDIRQWYQHQGQYFYTGNNDRAFLFPPHLDDYMHIIKDVLGAGVAAQTHVPAQWRPPQQRQVEGKPLIASLTAKWHDFQQAQGSHADRM